MSIEGRKFFMCSDFVTDVDYIDIDYSSASFADAPIITASADKNDVNIFASLVTRTTARLNFSAKISGRVTYIITEGG